MSELTKEEYVVEFVKAFKAIEDEMEPYKQHKRDIRKNYDQNGWLMPILESWPLSDNYDHQMRPQFARLSLFHGGSSPRQSTG